MADQIGQDPQIDEILEELLSPGPAERIELLEKLLVFHRRRDIEQVYQYFMQAGVAGVASIRWLVRYLVRVGRPYAYQKIFLLAQNRNDAIREEARNGLLRIEEETRLEMLLAMLRSEYPSEVCFAVDWLGEHRVVAAVPHLLDLYRQSSDEVIPTRIVRAFGNMRHIEALVALEQLLPDTDEKMERAVLFSLSRLAEGRLQKTLPVWLKADSPRLRSLAAYKILGKRGRNWERLAAAELASEERPEIKIELLSAVVHIETEHLLEVVLRLALSDPSDRVRQLGQSVVRQHRSHRLLEWLLKFAPHCPKEQMAPLLRILSDYKDTRVVELILRQFERSSDPVLKLAILQILGEIGDRRALGMLQDLVFGDRDYSPAAAIALSHVIDLQDTDFICRVLEDGTEPLEFARDCLLHLLAGYEGTEVMSDRLQQAVAARLADARLQTRYLAVGAFAATGRSDRVERLIDLFLSDLEKEVRRAALRAIEGMAEKEQRTVTQLLLLGEREPRVLTIVRAFFAWCTIEQVDLRAVVRQIVVALESGEGRGEREVQRRLLAILRFIMRKHPARFMTLLNEEKWSDREISLLLSLLNRTALYSYPGLDIRFMIDQFASRPFDVQLEMVRFFSRFTGDLSEVERVVFSTFRSTSDAALLARLERLIGDWIGRWRWRPSGRTIQAEGREEVADV